jgi:hypothetical protein
MILISFVAGDKGLVNAKPLGQLALARIIHKKPTGWGRKVGVTA